MSVFKRWNGTQWETIGPGISSARFENINNMIAPEFDPKNTYNIGDYVVQSDKLYRCINRIGTPQAWIGGNWQEVKLGQDVTELRNDVVVVSNTQPTSENNRIWIKPDNNEVKIPLVEEVMMLPNPNNYGENDQIPRSTGMGIEWVDYGLPSDQQTEDAINAWLNAHPEATTTVQDHSLSYKKLINGTLNFVTPEMYDAKGDGITDDTEAVQAAIDSGYNVICNGIYGITDTLVINNNCLIGGTIIALNQMNNMISIDGDNVEIGTNFNGNQLAINAISCNGNYHNIKIHDCEIYNVKAIQDTQCNCIYISSSNSDILIDKCYIHDTYPFENAAVGDVGGSAQGILIGIVTNCVIQNCIFENIRGYEDGDTIQIYGLSSGEYNLSDVIIQNNSFKNFYKRAIKIQATGCQIKNNYIFSNFEDNKNYAGISYYGNNGIIENNHIIISRGSYGIGCINNNHIIKNNYIYLNNNSSYAGAENATNGIGFTSGISDNIIIENNIIKGYPSIAISIQTLTNSQIKNNIIDNYHLGISAQVTISDSSIIGNIIYGGNSNAIRCVECNKIIVENNIGYNIFRLLSITRGTPNIKIRNNTVYCDKTETNIVYFNDVSDKTNIDIDINQFRQIFYGTTIPTGNYKRGSICYNTTPTIGGYIGWICVTGGENSIWAPFGEIKNT